MAKLIMCIMQKCLALLWGNDQLVSALGMSAPKLPTLHKVPHHLLGKWPEGGVIKNGTLSCGQVCLYIHQLLFLCQCFALKGVQLPAIPVCHSTVHCSTICCSSFCCLSASCHSICTCLPFAPSLPPFLHAIPILLPWGHLLFTSSCPSNLTLPTYPSRAVDLRRRIL